jgi:hypothetical protein
MAVWVDRDFADARAFGFLRERDIARFVTITCTYLASFPDRRYSRALREVLHDREAPPETRLKRFETWARAKAKSVRVLAR